MLSVGFSTSFIQTILSEEEEVNNQRNLVHNAENLETLLSSNDIYKKKGKIPNEKSTQSPIVTPNNATSMSSAPTSLPI
jgi:hypothetical protein